MQTLYRFYDDTDRLLYVGVTMNPPRRFRTHEGTKGWWAEVSHIALESYLERADVLSAEAAAIRNERPVYNVALNGETVLCHVCRRPVEVDPDDEPDAGQPRHMECDAAFCDAYDTGWKSGWERGLSAGRDMTFRQTLGDRIGHKLVSAHCDGVHHEGVEKYSYRRSDW